MTERPRVRVSRHEAEFAVPRSGSSPRRVLTRVAEQSVMVVLSLVALVPLYAMVITSLKPTAEFNRSPGSLALPENLTFQNYAEAWNDLGFSEMLQNSLFLSITSAIFVTLFATAAGFALSRMRLRGGHAFFVTTIGLMSVPAIVVVVPLFSLMSDAGILNSALAAPIAEIGLGIPFAVFLVYTFMLDIPEDLFSAASVDGASRLRQLVHIAIPQAQPAIVTVALITAIFAWNDLLVPLLLWQDPDLQVLMVGLANLAPGKAGSVDIPLIMAGVGISVVPIIALFMLLRRFVTEGLLSGAVKG